MMRCLRKILATTLHPATLSTPGNFMRYQPPYCRTVTNRCSFFPLESAPECVVTAPSWVGDLQGKAAQSLLNTTEECFYPFLNHFYKFLTTPQMHLVNIQCDNAPERALHFTGEEIWKPSKSHVKFRIGGKDEVFLIIETA